MCPREHAETKDAEVDAGPLRLQLRDAAEYWSSTQGGWVACEVLAVSVEGSVQIDCKPGYWLPPCEQAAKLKPRAQACAVAARGGGGPAAAAAAAAPPAPAPPLYELGRQAEYFSATLGRWVRCCIEAVHADGAVELDVKRGWRLDVRGQAEKLRAAGGGCGAASAPAAAAALPRGDGDEEGERRREAALPRVATPRAAAAKPQQRQQPPPQQQPPQQAPQQQQPPQQPPKQQQPPQQQETLPAKVASPKLQVTAPCLSVSVVSPGAGTRANAAAYASLAEEACGDGPPLRVRLLGRSGAAYDCYPPSWPGGRGEPNLESFAAQLPQGSALGDCLVVGSRGGQVVLPALWRAAGASVPPAVVINGGCAMALPGGPTCWPNDAVSILLLGGRDELFTGRLSPQQYLADAQSRVPLGNGNTAILLVREMTHMPQTALLRGVLPHLVLAAVAWRASGAPPGARLREAVRALAAGGWSGALAYTTRPGMWESLLFSPTAAGGSEPNKRRLLAPGGGCELHERRRRHGCGASSSQPPLSSRERLVPAPPPARGELDVRCD